MLFINIHTWKCYSLQSVNMGCLSTYLYLSSLLRSFQLTRLLQLIKFIPKYFIFYATVNGIFYFHFEAAVKCIVMHTALVG